MNRAYSLIEVKSLDDSKRVFSGWATTPEPDRMLDTINPLGAKFANPLVLLHQHDSDRPIGRVTFKKPTAKGIEFEAEIPVIDEPGPLKDRVDTAWGELKHGLVRAVSIGFRSMKHAHRQDGGIDFDEVEIVELSTVSVPANARAIIHTVKAIDREARGVLTEQKSIVSEQRAASGRSEAKATPAASGDRKKPVVTKGQTMAKKSTADQIAEWQSTREQKSADMAEIMAKSNEGETLDSADQEAFDALETEIEQIDGHIKRLKVLQKAAVETAKDVRADPRNVAGADGRAPVSVKAPAPEAGIRFARFAKCLGIAHKSHRDPVAIATELYGERDPKMVTAVKAAVIASNTTTDAALIGNEGGWADFVEYLRPRTILGRFGQNGIPGVTRIPFRVPLITEATESAAYWVGEGKPKPLTKASWIRTEMAPLKVATISVATMEQLRDSSPSGEALIRDSLVNAIAKRQDQSFIDPTNSGSAGVSPASITNGLSGNAFASGGQDIDAIDADAQAAIGKFIAANNDLSSGVWVMSALTALYLSGLKNALGQKEYPGLTMNGGVFFGLPVITSQYVGEYVALINAADIYVGDEGGVTIDISTEASLQMMDNPTNDTVSATPVATDLVSLWQTNSVGFLAERTVNWMRRRPTAVALITGVTWGIGAS